MEVELPDAPQRLAKDMAAAFYRLAVLDGYATLGDLESVLPDLERHRPFILPEHRNITLGARDRPQAR